MTSPTDLERLRAPYTSTSRSDAVTAVGCIFVLALAPIGIVLHEIYVTSSLAAVGAALCVAVGILLAIYVYVSVDVTIEVDSRFVRISRQRRVGSLRGAIVVTHLVPLDALSSARELRAHAPGKNGGWTVRHELQFAEHGTIKADDLPADPMTGPFRELVSRVAVHLGDRFRVDEDFGPMTAVVERRVQEELARRQPPQP